MAWSLQTLVRSPWLSQQPAPVARSLLDLGRVQAREAGQPPFAVGGGGLFAVITGRLAVSASPGRRHGAVLVDLLQPGSWMVSAAHDSDEPPAVTVAPRNAARLFLIPDEALARLPRTRSDVWRSIAALAQAQHEAAMRGVARLLTAPPATLIAARLIALAEGRPPFVALSQAELGAMCGLTRKAINGHLGAMEEAGLVARAYGRVDLIDLPALRRVAAG